MSTIIFLAFIATVLAALTYIETHATQIRSELAIRELISKTIVDARYSRRNPVRYVSAGYKPKK